MKGIILDIDGTLICYDDVIPYARPYLKEFLKYLFDKFEYVAIWSAASEWWVNLVYKKILKPLLPEGKEFLFLWSGKRCTQIIDFEDERNNEFYPISISIKRLKKVWKRYKFLNKHNTLILDDTKETYIHNYGNAIPIPTYELEQKEDNLLQCLIPFLDKLLILESVRKTEKRNWWYKLIEISREVEVERKEEREEVNKDKK